MIIATSDTMDGKKVKKVLGIVKGNTIRARNIGRDIIASFKNLIGGEIEEYTKLMGEAREQAVDRMKEEAKNMGANGIVCVRFSTSYIMSNAAEILVYGTAVIVEEELVTGG